MDRRQLFGLIAAAPMAAAAAKYSYHLRYAPRIGMINEPIERQFEIIAENGFTAFEYNGLPKHSMTEIEQFRKKMDSLGLSMGTMVVNRGGWKPSAMVHPKFHADFLADVKKAVEIHKVIGNEVATVCSGLAADDLSYTQQTTNCIEVLKRAGELCAGTKLKLVLEPLNVRVDHAGYFVVFSDHGAEIVANANHPNVRLLFDCYHQQISEGNLINHIRKHYAWIGYFQTGDVPGRKEPGTGEVNWSNVFKAIHGLGYQGLIGMEHGLSQPGMPGLMKCFDEYRKADAWSA
ncbi:MAG: TIM barrel protein [Acidobacteria bacterium]|nr:TIM barrel protein [Acidobacteriota bacterium]